MYYILIWIEKFNVYLFKYNFFFWECFFLICLNEKLKFGVDFNKKNIVVDFWYIISNFNWYKNVYEYYYCKIDLSMVFLIKVFKEGKKYKMNKVYMY